MKKRIRFTKTLGSRIFNDYYALKDQYGYMDDNDNETPNGTFVFVTNDTNPTRVFLAYSDEFEYIDTPPYDSLHITFTEIVQNIRGNILANFGSHGTVIMEQEHNKLFPNLWVVRNETNGHVFIVDYNDFEYRSYDPTKPIEERFK